MNRKTFLMRGREMRDESKPQPILNTSWQSVALREGWIERDKEIAGELDAAVEQYADNRLAAFPARMPAPTRAHVAYLNSAAMNERDSTRALRLDRKITALYQRYA